MARIFITGSTDGLGRAAARSLLDDGHEVFLHARSTERASTLADLASQAAGVVIGDLRSAAEIHRIAEQVNAIGRMNAVIQMPASTRRRDAALLPRGMPASWQ
jgi:NAD(P)-dependent dehydrogenase (short-subunit alcohol dehydrogenase family)